jgi:hypothetical protein
MQTLRDQQIVRWLGEPGAAAAVDDVGQRFGMGRSWSWRCLQLLVKDELLVERRVLHRQPGLYVATVEGLRWCGLRRFGGYRVGAGGFEHAKEVARVAAELHHALPGWEVLSERTIRSDEADAGDLTGRSGSGSCPAAGRRCLDRISRCGRKQVVWWLWKSSCQ